MKKLFLNILQEHKRVFVGLLIIDVVIVTLHIFFGQEYSFFHLDIEKNLPTTYQSCKLILFGLLFLTMTVRLKVSTEMRSFIQPLTVVFLFLGLDELFQIHENIYRIFEFLPWLHPSKIVTVSMQLGYRSSLWILYYLPLIFIFVLWSGYWLRAFQTMLKSNFWIIGLSILSLFVVLLAEIVSSTGVYSEGSYFWLVTFEEMAEMLFVSTLVMVGLKSINKGILKF